MRSTPVYSRVSSGEILPFETATELCVKDVSLNTYMNQIYWISNLQTAGCSLVVAIKNLLSV